MQHVDRFAFPTFLTDDNIAVFEGRACGHDCVWVEGETNAVKEIITEAFVAVCRYADSSVTVVQQTLLKRRLMLQAVEECANGGITLARRAFQTFSVKHGHVPM